MIIINMDKAKDIWRNKIRFDRISILEKLDIAYLRSLETNNIYEQQTIIAKKQKLRDAPTDPRIDNATKPEELLNINPITEIGY